jgi:hypothetical protein
MPLPDLPIRNNGSWSSHESSARDRWQGSAHLDYRLHHRSALQLLGQSTNQEWDCHQQEQPNPQVVAGFWLRRLGY